MTRTTDILAGEPPRRLTALDVFAMALGYALLLAIVIAASVAMLDRIEGRPDQVWSQVQALLTWIDGRL